MIKKKVGILYGTGTAINSIYKKNVDFLLQNLDTEAYIPIEVELTEENLFLVNEELFTLDEVSKEVDVLFNCLKGKIADDGKLQKKFELSGIEFIGSSALSSSLSSSKSIRKEVLEKFSIKTPAFELVKIDQDTDIKKVSLKLFSNLPQPCVFKRGSHAEILSDKVCENPRDIESVLFAIQSFGEAEIEVDEYLQGENVTIAGIENYIDGSGELYFTPFETETGETVSAEGGKNSLEVTKDVFKNLGLSGHFMVDLSDSKRGTYVLSIKNFPDLYDDSIFVKLIADYGIGKRELLTHLIENQLK